MSLIVIVDDRISNRNIFAQLARSIERDITVRTFGDPTKALEWLAANTPDLIITDYKMPEMDASEFIRRFRTLPSSSDIPVIVITVFEERSYRLQALEAGATDFLNSPVDHHEFLTRARNLLSLRKHQLLLASRADSLKRELEHSERSRERALRDSRERLAQVIDTLPVMISAADRDGRILFANACETTFFDMGQSQVVGAVAASLFGEEAAARSIALDRRVFETGNPLPSYEEEIIDRNGEAHVFLSTKAPLKDDANVVTGVLTTSFDITARKRDEARLRHLAHHDALTDLPNRHMLAERIRTAVTKARRGSGNFAIHLVDLDRFKYINDLLGHTGGDRFLKAMADHLVSSLSDAEMIARLGGDEFAILQSNVRGGEEAAAFAKSIVDTIGGYVDSCDSRPATTASVGVALYPADGSDAESLLKNADLAMYKAKNEGGNLFCFFAADLQSRVHQAAQLDRDLREALSNNEFRLYYQPQIDLTTGRIIGAEALLRWDRGPDGILTPGAFLYRAEENGLILPISEWVLREACREAKSWQRAGLPPLRVAVNLSPLQFRGRTLPLLIVKVLGETGLDPDHLELELTESIVMHDLNAVADDLKELTELGVHIAVDDFGTGYSSFGYVKRFPVSRLKIDQSFIRNMAEDPNDEAIVRAIIMLGHSLNISVVAEGVETEDQLARLRSEGCDEVQGYLFGRPMPPARFVDLLRSEFGLGQDRMRAANMRESGRTILIGEDNRTVARVIGKILENDGYKVHPVATGPEALDALFNQQLDLALLDANLRGTDAMEVTNLYRFGSVGRRRLPILGVIGEMSAAKLSAWIEAGLDGCIGKPIEPTELLEAVNSCLGQSEVQPPPLARSIPEETAQGPAVDARVLRDLEKLGGQGFVDDVIAQFAADASRLLPELSVSAAAEDTSMFRDNIHALRSCAGNVGAVGLYKLCLASQTMTPRELLGDGGGYVARLKSEFERAVSALDQHEWRASAPLQQVG